MHKCKHKHVQIGYKCDEYKVIALNWQYYQHLDLGTVVLALYLPHFPPPHNPHRSAFLLVAPLQTPIVAFLAPVVG